MTVNRLHHMRHSLQGDMAAGQQSDHSCCSGGNALLHPQAHRGSHRVHCCHRPARNGATAAHSCLCVARAHSTLYTTVLCTDTHTHSQQQRRSWAAWRVHTTAAPTQLAGAVCIQRTWRHCTACACYKCAVMRLQAALRRHASQQQAWAAWHAYTTAKLAKAADTVPARRHTGMHMPRMACLALATLPILLQAAWRWQDTHAERSTLPAPRRQLGMLGIWLHRARQ